jgi:hypothetical protein
VSSQSHRILVTAGPRIVEKAGPERVRRLLSAPNVKIIRKRKTGAIVAIQLLDFGDNLRLSSSYANPQAALAQQRNAGKSARCVDTEEAAGCFRGGINRTAANPWI